MWTLHNTLVHGKDTSDEDLRTRLTRKIEYLHRLKSKVVPTHRAMLFIEDLPNKLADKKFKMQEWINSHERAIYYSMHQQQKHPIKDMQHLDKWFTVTRKPRRPPKPKLRNVRARRSRVQSNKIHSYLRSKAHATPRQSLPSTIVVA